ncbi:MAG: T9SS type A sorting domain-containing protein [Bacteroidia bacterium]
MNKRTKLRICFFVSIGLFLLPNTIHSQITNFSVYPEPSAPALPAAGNTFTDPVFNTSLLRVTDAADGNDNHLAYSYWPAMNMNSSHLYVMKTNIGPTLYDFNPVTFTIANKSVAFISNCPSGFAPNAEDAIWSDVNPDIIFVHDQNLHLYAYNVSTTTYSLVKDMSTALPAGAHSWQMNKNHTNDDLFSFTWKDNSWNVVGYLTWRSSTDQFISGPQSNLDECQPDRAGNYLILKLAASGSSVVQARILNLSTSVFADITDGGPANLNTPGLYWAPGHGDMGNGTVLGHDDWNNRLVGRTAANPSAFYSVLDLNNDWSQDYHGSHLADNVNWITLSAYVSNTLTNSGLFKNEIFQVSTDGLQNVRRLAHHHSDFLPDYAANGGGNAYWSSPKGCISKDGNWIVFTSNWGSTTRKDVFILKNPSQPTSTGTIKPGDEISIFPNPSCGNFIFKGGDEETEIIIYNLMGDKILVQKFNTHQTVINLESQPKGIYFYSIKNFTRLFLSGKLIVE